MIRDDGLTWRTDADLKSPQKPNLKTLDFWTKDGLTTMNLSGTINTFRLLYAPRLARPHVVLSQFNELTFPLGKCIKANVKRLHGVDVPEPDIRAVVIDKDNCIARPHALEVWPSYQVFQDKSGID